MKSGFAIVIRAFLPADPNDLENFPDKAAMPKDLRKSLTEMGYEVERFDARLMRKRESAA